LLPYSALKICWTRRKEMLKILYEWLYTRIGGRPWSYIARDSFKKYPIFWILGFLVGGVVLGHIFW